MENQAVLELKKPENTNTNKVLTTGKLLNRGMTEDECRLVCTSPIIPLREKLFFRMIYETQFRPDETRNLLIENWDRNQQLITAVKVKQKTKPLKGNKHKKEYLPAAPRTAVISDTTNDLLRTYISNRKKGAIFINKSGRQLSLVWFNDQINKYAVLLGLQKTVRYYKDGRRLKLVTCMALREAGERHHDNRGGSRKLSATAAGHTMQVKERHYEKVGEDFEQVHDSYRKHHPAFTNGW